MITKPVDETLLLARLRSLLRQSHTEQDLRIHAGTAHALGFAEATREFHHPGRVALVSDDKSSALRMKAALGPLLRHDLIPLAADQAITPPSGMDRPELFVLHVDAAGPDAGLRLMAELRAAPETRNAAVILMLAGNRPPLAATALDMGADDVVDATILPSELRLRIAAQLRKKRAADRMRNQLKSGLRAAVVDPLTGLYNRRYALSFLERLAAAAWDGGRPFAVMVADLDHFKQVNDQFGHAAGDAVLVRVARELRRQLGENDLVARIGGEEFLIAIPDTTRAEARQTACKLCRVIEEMPVSVPVVQEPLHVTISIGATMGLPLQGPRPRVTALLEQADRALYRAKADGRNTVTLAARSAA